MPLKKIHKQVTIFKKSFTGTNVLIMAINILVSISIKSLSVKLEICFFIHFTHIHVVFNFLYKYFYLRAPEYLKNV